MRLRQEVFTISPNLPRRHLDAGRKFLTLASTAIDNLVQTVGRSWNPSLKKCSFFSAPGV